MCGVCMHLCSEKYRLELHWDRAEFVSDNIVKLVNAYFSGPVLAIVVDIKAPDQIDLDFTGQHFKILNDYHIARLSWFESRREDKKIYLGTPILTSLVVNDISKLEDKNSILIDTSRHEIDDFLLSSCHGTFSIQVPLVYKSYILKEDGDLKK